jgi:hypothetical protein
MIDRDRDDVGAGDPRLDEDTPPGGAAIPGTPGYESEASFRHRQSADADIPEVRSNQLAPGPLQEATDEPILETQTLKFNQETRHQSK